MNDWKLVLDVLMLLAVALGLGVVCERLRQSALVGYVLAGVLLGPNALDMIGSRDQIDALAELGVALLLFTIGLEFSWQRMLRMGRVAFGGGSLQVLATGALAAGVALLLGLDGRAAVAVGAIIALSSTACVLRVLMDRSELDSIHGRDAMAILLFQDIAVVPLVLLVGMLGSDSGVGEVLWRTGSMLMWAAGLIAALYVILNLVLPGLMGAAIMARNRELPILLALITAIGSAYAAHAAGLPAAMGAFVAGILLAESPFAAQIRADVVSLRTLLVTLFFSTVGMLADPLWMAQHALLVAGLVIAILFGKAVIVGAAVRCAGTRHWHGLATGICLAQVGEFSFVLAMLARKTVIDEQTFKLMISATIVTLILTPYLVAAAPRLARLAQQSLSPRSGLTAPAPEEAGSRSLVVIVGYGPAGQGVGITLVRHDVAVTVLDANRRTAQIAEQCGFVARVGDATHVAVLEHAGVPSAHVVVITLPDPTAARRVIEHVRSLAPEARIVTRARYHVYRMELEFAGSHVVVDEEEQVGLSLAAETRNLLGDAEERSTS
jgi:CPA2 family monovalent cation:H+ antiporter-2